MKKTMLCLMFLLLVSSCGNVDKNDYLLYDAKLNSYIKPNNNDYELYLNKYNDFSADLTFKYLNEFNDNNLCLSPLSIFINLQLLSKVASEETKNEILDSMDLEEELIDKCFPEFINNHLIDKNDSIEIISNALIIDEDVRYNKFVEKLAQNYYCDIFKYDLSSQKGFDYLNDYVNSKTNNVLNFDLKANDAAEFELLSAFYFKDSWFTEYEYTDEDILFLNSNGTEYRDKFLISNYNYGKLESNDICNYFYVKTANDYKVSFITSKTQNIRDIFNKELINHVIDNEYEVDEDIDNYTRIIFPKFKSQGNNDICELLKNKYNINSAFAQGKSNFIGLSDEELAISRSIHKSVVSVDNKGIEAAAVTINEFADESVKEYYDFVINKEFAFIITNNNNEIMFTGIVDNITN